MTGVNRPYDGSHFHGRWESSPPMMKIMPPMMGWDHLPRCWGTVSRITWIISPYREGRCPLRRGPYSNMMWASLPYDERTIFPSGESHIPRMMKIILPYDGIPGPLRWGPISPTMRVISPYDEGRFPLRWGSFSRTMG